MFPNIVPPVAYGKGICSTETQLRLYAGDRETLSYAPHDNNKV